MALNSRTTCWRLLSTAAMLCATFALTGCRKDRQPVAPQTIDELQIAELAGISAQVVDSRVGRLVLLNGERAEYSRRNFLAVRVRFVNESKRIWRYRPQHGKASYSSGHYPTLKRTDGSKVKHVYFASGERSARQRVANVSLKPDESTVDTFLFDLQTSESGLELSLPYRLMGWTSTVRVRLKPKTPTLSAVSPHTVVTSGKFEVVVKSATSERVVYNNAGARIQIAPRLFVITLGLKNISRARISGNPATLLSPALWSADFRSVAAVTVPPAVPGATITLAPGDRGVARLFFSTSPAPNFLHLPIMNGKIRTGIHRIRLLRQKSR